MKNQVLFSLKDKSKKLKCRLLQFLFGALRVNIGVDANASRKQCLIAVEQLPLSCTLSQASKVHATDV